MANSAGQARGIERLYLDFDSFFASAEQHFNAALRGRPIGVVPLDSPHTSCIAVSREAKARGVKSGASIRDAREIIPDMVFVIARHDVYVRLHKRILGVIDTVVPVAKVRSIDEVVCNLLPHEGREGAALALRLKSALAESFSETLTCSIGMAPTELLAKIAAEMNKPDGFKLIRADDLPGALSDIPLGDLPGISKGMHARLAAVGVHDFAALWRLAPKQARAIWGSVEGERFWNGIHGYHTERPDPKKSMFGHSRMLPWDWRTPEKVASCARQLTLSASRRLRREGLRATRLTLSFRGGGHRAPDGTRRDALDWGWEGAFPPARDDHTFLQSLSKGLAKSRADMRFSPRSVSIMIHGLVEDHAITGELFGGAADASGDDDASRAKWEKVSDLMDHLRQAHGSKAISLGPREDVPGGYIGAKIAFGRIPDEEDFSEAPSADEETRFLSY
ncbi:Y-family DNA polymerase [Roseivivax sp. CAU 1761]